MIDLIKKLANDNFNEIVDIRRHLHKHPELSFQEHNTSKYLKHIKVLYPFNISYELIS